MERLRPILIAAAAMTLMSCDEIETPPASPAAPVATDTFIAATADIKRSTLPALVVAFDADPVGVVDRLESDVGGASALRRYATTMLSEGRSEDLGRQLAAVQSDGEALARPEKQDGSTWYPRAQDAGFFTGGVGAVLASHPDALPAFAKGAGRSPPGSRDNLEAWLSEPVATLPRPARSAFDGAFRAAAYRERRPD